jgi:tetratricopeptide (TPR) repeat protein
MQKMAASMSGGAGMPPGAAEQMRNMTADDMKRAAAEMGNMDAEQLKSQYTAAMNQTKAQASHMLSGAEQLKKDGNTLVGQGKYTDAIEKYMRVKNNLKDDNSPGAVALRTSCMLNMSLCFNKTNRFNSAISECKEVLATDGKSLKAYYRRGQAFAFKGDLRLAVGDLRRAVALSPGDETVKAELDKAVSDLVASGETDDGETPPFEESVSGSVTGGAGRDIANSMANSMGLPPDAMAKATEAMKDPEFMSKASALMENMTDEQLAAMTKNMPGGGAGMPKIDPKMAKQAASMMKNMNPEAMQGMMKMAAEMKDMGMDPASGMGVGGPWEDMMSKMAEKMKDPAMQVRVGAFPDRKIVSSPSLSALRP